MYPNKKTRILASVKDKGQRTRDGGTEDGKQRNKGQDQWNTVESRRKWDIGTVDSD
jgi:hypothetical protein